MIRTSLLVVGCYLLCAFTGGSLHAQMAKASYKGKIISLSPDGWIGIRVEGGDKVIFAGVSKERKEDGVGYRNIAEPKVEIQATETVKGLAVGMYVRFAAKVVNKRRVLGVVEEVTVFHRTENSVFGMLPNNIGPPAAEGANQEAAPADAEDMLISGQLTAAKGTSITVAIPDAKPLRVKLSRDAVVKIRSGDLRLIRIGDNIDVTGLAVKPTKIFALEATITRGDATDDKGPKVARNPRGKKGNPKKPAPPEAFNPGPPAAADAGQPKGEDPPAAKPEVVGKILRIN